MDPKFASGKDLFKCHSPLEQKPNSRDYLRVIFISHPETNSGTTSLHLPEFSEYVTSWRVSPQQNSSSPLKVARLTFKNHYGHSFLNKSWSAGLKAPFLTLCEVKWCKWSPPVWPWVLKFIEVHQNLEPKHRTFPINLTLFRTQLVNQTIRKVSLSM